MLKQYITPVTTTEAFSLQHYLQTESVTDVSGDLGYSGGGHGGGRAPKRDDIEENIEENIEHDDLPWGTIW